MKETEKLSLEEINKLKDLSCKIRCHILTIVKDAAVGHIGGSLSVTDILTALYFKVLNIDPKNPDWDGRDRLILSKGHGAAAIYSTLAERGFFPAGQLKTFGNIDSNFQVHPDRTKVPGIEASTGALGQGLSVAAGMALAARLDGKDYHTFAILGDGETQEGQIWEAAMFSAHYKLDNLTAVLDYNNVQLMGNVSDIMEVAPVDDKWKSFGWNVIKIEGHDFRQIIESLDSAKEYKGRPTIIIADTVKGKGVSFMQNSCTWHGNVPSEEEYDQAIKELKSNQ
ncbi:MAG: transketolase [Actinomycetia bacterium]|nr:transketolase [Actinomycetes bacterium]